jgi:uncharacterized protein YbjT (DUF2867 family)
MADSDVHIVTGACGYSGKYIVQLLLERGVTVATLTNSMSRENPFGEKVRAYPLDFGDSAGLEESLRGGLVLYNTYWVRFNHGDFSLRDALENSFRLVEAAKKAGIKRLVHISITNPREDSPLEYFRGKAQLEKGIINSGLSYAILRPAALFGREGILINNIAWMLRNFPFFALPGRGDYRLQPLHVRDLAELAVNEGARRQNTVIEAIGPETYTYRELVQTIGQSMGIRRPLISLPAPVVYVLSAIMGFFLRDIVTTKDEIAGLMANLLYVEAPPQGVIKLSEWLKENAQELGKHYMSELARRRKRLCEYGKL